MGKKITSEELAEWRRVYPTGGSTAVQALFPHRSKNTINVTAHMNGIKIADMPAFRDSNLRAARSARRWAGERQKAWTKTETDILHSHYLLLGWRGIAPLLPGRSGSAIRTRAFLIGAAKSNAPVFQRDYQFKATDLRRSQARMRA